MKAKRTDIELACTQYMDAIKELQEKNAGLEVDVARAKDRTTILESALEEARHKIQVLQQRVDEAPEQKPISPVQESRPSNSSIDRQVIASLVLQYFTANPSIQLDCLVLMTKVLGLMPSPWPF